MPSMRSSSRGHVTLSGLCVRVRVREALGECDTDGAHRQMDRAFGQIVGQAVCGDRKPRVHGVKPLHVCRKSTHACKFREPRDTKRWTLVAIADYLGTRLAPRAARASLHAAVIVTLQGAAHAREQFVRGERFYEIANHVGFGCLCLRPLVRIGRPDHAATTAMPSFGAADMIFSVAAIVAFVSRHATLKPDDIIATGTPEGVPLGQKAPQWLKAGDEVSVEIERLGRLTNRLVAPPSGLR
jgi:Fumarylacetoacetate (FAA) hydrolase family